MENDKLFILGTTIRPKMKKKQTYLDIVEDEKRKIGEVSDKEAEDADSFLAKDLARREEVADEKSSANLDVLVKEWEKKNEFSKK